ncbi:MAG: hypothetical protein ACLUFV_00890 [Acutalibacteraceae bacterium]
MGFFDKLKAGLKKTKHALFGPLDDCSRPTTKSTTIFMRSFPTC